MKHRSRIAAPNNRNNSTSTSDTNSNVNLNSVLHTPSTTEINTQTEFEFSSVLRSFRQHQKVTTSNIIQLQRTFGNKAVQSLIRRQANFEPSLNKLTHSNDVSLTTPEQPNAANTLNKHNSSTAAAITSEFQSSTIHRYYEASSQETLKPLRISDDNSMAMVINPENKKGSQEVYLKESIVQQANQQLETNSSPFRFEKGEGEVKLEQSSHSATTTTTTSSVTPSSITLPRYILKRCVTKSSNLEPATLIGDCGEAAKEVTGATYQSTPSVLTPYYTKENQSFKASSILTEQEKEKKKFEESTPLTDPLAYEAVRYEVLANLVGGSTWEQNKDVVHKYLSLFEKLENKSKEVYTTLKVSLPQISATELPGHAKELAEKTDLSQFKIKWKRESVEKTIQEFLEMYRDYTTSYKQSQEQIVGQYNKVNQNGKADRDVGINDAAAPKIGEGYLVVRGGNSCKKGADWNYHWGGVVVTSDNGQDNLTLENYGGAQPDEWVFQMYGLPNEKGEVNGRTFHSYHKNIMEAYGDTPTTFKVVKK